MLQELNEMGIALQSIQQTGPGFHRVGNPLRYQTEQERQIGTHYIVDDVVRPDLAFLLSLVAQGIADTVEARASLLNALQSNAHLVQFLQHEQAAPMYSTAFSPDNSLVAA